MQQWGVNYWETLRTCHELGFSTHITFDIEHTQLGNLLVRFFLSFPQADLDIDMFMDLPMGIKVCGDCRHLLKLNKSLYGLKKASENWF